MKRVRIALGLLFVLVTAVAARSTTAEPASTGMLTFQVSAVPRDGTDFFFELSGPANPNRPTFLAHLGGPGEGFGLFNYPYGLAVAPSGLLYIADRSNHLIQVYDRNGGIYDEWGGPGSGDGQLSFPYGVAVAPDGTVYVADTHNHRIQRFAANGDYLGRFGSEGSNDGQFRFPYDVAVAPDGTVYVADTANNRIQRFTGTGAFLGKWGSFGSKREQFIDPSGIAVAPNGTVFVADQGNHQVKLFDRDGAFPRIVGTGSPGSASGQFSSPYDVAIAPDGTFLVADSGNDRLQRFSAGGRYLSAWSGSGLPGGSFDTPSGVAVGTDGTVYAADTDNHRIQKFLSAGFLLDDAETDDGDAYPGLVAFNALPAGSYEVGERLPHGWTLDNIECTGAVNSTVTIGEGSSVGVDLAAGEKVHCTFAHAGPGSLTFVKSAAPRDGLNFHFDLLDRFTDGKFLVNTGQWGSFGSQDGYFIEPHGIAVAGDGSVLVADAFNSRVQRLAKDGTFLGQWGSKGSAAGEFDFPAALAVSATGSVYVADRDNHRIQKFSLEGSWQGGWGTYGSGAGLFSSPSGVAVGTDGHVYVADSGNNRIQQFDAGGNYLTSLYAGEAGVFNIPTSVAVDMTGAVYVLERDGCRVQKFDADGRYLTWWGESCSLPGQFRDPKGITAAPDGTIYVADLYSIMRFDPAGAFLGSWQYFVLGNGDVGEFYSPEDVAVAADGTIFVADTVGDQVLRFLAQSFILDDAAPDDGDSFKDSVSYDNVPAERSYRVSEHHVDGRPLTGITCAGAAASTVAIDLAARTVTIDLASAEHVTCTFSSGAPLPAAHDLHLPIILVK